MYRVFFFWLLLAAPAAASVIDSQIFLNEFHYDNEGADRDEFVEVVVPDSFEHLASVTLTLYNGSSGTSYSGPTDLTAFTPGDVVDGYAFYTLDVALQNGAPDALALAWDDDVLQFLSYEGTFTALDGVAQGLVSTDVNVLEGPDSPVGSSLQLAGEGDSYADFFWQPAAPNTYGTINVGQSFAVPEPTGLCLWLGTAALATFLFRRRRRASA